MSLDIFAAYATDKALENNGSWFDLGSGARVLVARAGNKAYSKMLSKLVQENQLVLNKNDDQAEVKSEELLILVMAETILLGWEGISYKGAKELPYSVDNAKMLLSHGDFRKQIAGFADDFNAYKAKVEDEQGKA